MKNPLKHEQPEAVSAALHDAQRKLISAISYDPGHLDRLHVHHDWFTDPQLRTMFLMLASFHREKPSASMVTASELTRYAAAAAGLSHLLHADGEIGGSNQVSYSSINLALDDGYYVTDQAPSHAAVLRETAAQQGLTEALADATSGTHNPREMLEKIQKVVDATGAKLGGSKNPHQSEMVLLRASEVEPEEVRWLWPNRIPLGKLSLFGGDPGLGKSHVTVDMAARVSRGTVWPDGSAGCEPGAVLFFSAEDDPSDTVVPRLLRAGADTDKVYLFETVKTTGEDGTVIRRGFDMTADLPKLERAVEQIGDIRLVVIDPVSSYLGSTDSHKNAEVRGMLSPLVDLAARYGFAVLCVTHLSKSGGTKSVYRSTGSLAFAAAARAVWQLSKDLDDERRRLMLPVKINIAPAMNGLGLRIESDIRGSYCQWEADPVEMTADEYLQKEADGVVSGEEKGELDRACDLIREILGAGPVPSRELEQAAKEHGISHSTLKRARIKTCVRPHKGSDGKWTVMLSEGQGVQTPLTDPLEPLEPLEPVALWGLGLTVDKHTEGDQGDQGDQEYHTGYREPLDGPHARRDLTDAEVERLASM